MLTIEAVRQLALALPEVEEKDHFGRPSFRVKGKIFATLWPKETRAMIKLSLINQSVFCDVDKTIFYPVPGGWGRKGSTFVDLKKVNKKIFKEALTSAWLGVVPKNFLKKYNGMIAVDE